jgi:hypothetical protein
MQASSSRWCCRSVTGSSRSRSLQLPAEVVQPGADRVAYGPRAGLNGDLHLFGLQVGALGYAGPEGVRAITFAPEAHDQHGRALLTGTAGAHAPFLLRRPSPARHGALQSRAPCASKSQSLFGSEAPVEPSFRVLDCSFTAAHPGSENRRVLAVLSAPRDLAPRAALADQKCAFVAGHHRLEQDVFAGAEPFVGITDLYVTAARDE